MPKKSVSFSDTARTHSYARPTAHEIHELYYQESDYRRFREDKWLDELREARANREKEGKDATSKSRRDSLNLMMNPCTPASKRNQRGIAQAA